MLLYMKKLFFLNSGFIQDSVNIFFHSTAVTPPYHLGTFWFWKVVLQEQASSSLFFIVTTIHCVGLLTTLVSMFLCFGKCFLSWMISTPLFFCSFFLRCIYLYVETLIMTVLSITCTSPALSPTLCLPFFCLALFLQAFIEFVFW